MTETKLFAGTVPVRITATDSLHRGAYGEVDAHELAESRRRDQPVSVRLGPDTATQSTVVFHDEIELVKP